MGMHALTKPTKFFISSILVAWAMAYFIPLLKKPKVLKRYTWTLVIVFGLENLYIVGQAFRGVRSHFNTIDWYGPMLFSLMGILISIFTIHTLVIGIGAWFLAKKAWAVHLLAVLYGALAVGILYWALLGRGILGW